MRHGPSERVPSGQDLETKPSFFPMTKGLAFRTYTATRISINPHAVRYQGSFFLAAIYSTGSTFLRFAHEPHSEAELEKGRHTYINTMITARRSNQSHICFLVRIMLSDESAVASSFFGRSNIDRWSSCTPKRGRRMDSSS